MEPHQLASNKILLNISRQIWKRTNENFQKRKIQLIKEAKSVGGLNGRFDMTIERISELLRKGQRDIKLVTMVDSQGLVLLESL